MDPSPAPAAPPLEFGPDGLIPAVIQDTVSGDVLMVGFMNADALAATRATGRTHFWSRSRRQLWRKGETSGHEQVVEEIYVNCERNSLLLRVRQIGAVCHDGYPTCYYRRLEPDNRLTVVRDRAFDPTTVYGAPEDGGWVSTPTASALDPLERGTRLLYGALAFLRDNDLTAVSRTSARLRRTTDTVRERVAQELRELAGALDGTHRHRGPREDVLLEGTQVLYWVLLSALRANVSWDRLRPDRALVTADDAVDVQTAARLLRAEARRWERGLDRSEDHAASCHAALALVGQACSASGIRGLDLVEADLGEMRSRPYLAPYFARHEAPSSSD